MENREEFVERNVGLVRSLVPRFLGRGIEYDDLFQAGCMGLVKAADKISAVIKCIEERKTGNREFLAAEETLRRAVGDMHLPEADLFVQEFLPAFEQSLDEYGK